MKRYGLIGRPLGHSFSAGYFAAKFRREGITGCDYALYELPSIEALPELLGAQPELQGFNVTMERADCQPAVQAAFEAAGWALDGQVHKEKLYYPAETPLVSALLEVYRDATGDNAPPKCIGGGTYAKMLPNVVAFGPLFAGDPVTEHQPDECIDLERLVQNAQIIANAIVKLANLPLE